MKTAAHAEPMFSVVVCPRCRKSRVVEPTKKTTTCGSCGKDLDLRNLQRHDGGSTLADAQQKAGQLNARLQGREHEFAAAFLPQKAAREARHDDAWAAAGAATRKAASEADRADAAARSLTEVLGAFGEDDLARAFRCAGIAPDKVESHLRRMLSASIIHEPRPTRYRAL